MIEPIAPDQNPNPPRILADFSPYRRQYVIGCLRDSGALHRPELDYVSQILLTIGLLVCDDTGFASHADIDRARNDPSVVNVARQIVSEALV